MQKARVLIIDGDVALSEIFKTRLEAMGFLADSVQKGKEAIRVLKTRWIDLIIMDIGLKGELKGFNLLNTIKKDEELSSIPVIVHTSDVSLQKALEFMGAELFLPKPYPIELLLAEVNDILTPKILVFGDNNDSRGKIVKKLAVYDFHIDIVTSISKFFQNILLFRYNLLVLQCKTQNNMADKLAFLVRGTAKNKNVPVIIFAVSRSSDITAQEEGKRQQVITQCKAISDCEFLLKENFNKKFSEAAKKYLF